MEQDKQISKQSQNFNLGLELLKAKTDIKISENSVDEIKAALRYIFVLLGINQKNIPQDLEKDVLINFIKSRLFYLSLSELKNAFLYAVERRIDVDLTLYGETFSTKFVMDVTTAYIQYRNKNIAKDAAAETPMINNDRFAAIIDLLKKSNPETVDTFKNIGKEKLQEKPKEKLPYHDFFQTCIKKFDELRKHESDPSGRFAIIAGQGVSLEEFVESETEKLINPTENTDLL